MRRRNLKHMLFVLYGVQKQLLCVCVCHISHLSVSVSLSLSLSPSLLFFSFDTYSIDSIISLTLLHTATMKLNAFNVDSSSPRRLWDHSHPKRPLCVTRRCLSFTSKLCICPQAETNEERLTFTQRQRWKRGRELGWVG